MNGLESLVNRYQAQAVHAAYLIVYDRALAEDVAQTAFVKVVDHIRQFDEARPFAPWFFRIVVNDALKALKKGQRNLSLEERTDDPATRHLAALLIDPHPQPEQWLEEKEMREHILAAVKSLSPEQRAVVVMRYFLDMSEADMSARLERPFSTIKWWLRSARKSLRNLINVSR